MVIYEFVIVLAGHGISGKPLFSLPMSRHFELLYNTGIQLLHCCKPLPAFDCLVEAVKVYSSNPRLWLRLSECCVMANKKVSVNCLLGLCLFIAFLLCLFIAPPFMSIYSHSFMSIYSIYLSSLSLWAVGVVCSAQS